MRINRYIAAATDISRRHADQLISEGRITVNSLVAVTGQEVGPKDKVAIDNKLLNLPAETILIMLNKPIGYVVSKNGQGSPTIYLLLEGKYQNLKPIGRLDKDSTGLLLMSNDGILINELAHPSFNKDKVYDVELNKPISKDSLDKLKKGVQLEDGLSKMAVKNAKDRNLTVVLSEGRNRQIRRTFEHLGYKVAGLNRTSFGKYQLNELRSGEYIEVNS